MNTPSKDDRQARFLDAYLKSDLRVYKACEVAEISRSTFYKWLQDDPEFAERFRDIYERLVDLSDSVLFAKLLEGDVEVAKFVRTKIGKNRDWNPTQNVDITSAGQPIQVIFGSGPTASPAAS